MPKIVISKQVKKAYKQNHEYPLWKMARGFDVISKMAWPAPPKNLKKGVSHA